jgi:hypothetical protein
MRLPYPAAELDREKFCFITHINLGLIRPGTLNAGILAELQTKIVEKNMMKPYCRIHLTYPSHDPSEFTLPYALHLPSRRTTTKWEK